MRVTSAEASALGRSTAQDPTPGPGSKNVRQERSRGLPASGRSLARGMPACKGWLDLTVRWRHPYHGHALWLAGSSLVGALPRRVDRIGVHFRPRAPLSSARNWLPYQLQCATMHVNFWPLHGRRTRSCCRGPTTLLQKIKMVLVRFHRANHTWCLRQQKSTVTNLATRSYLPLSKLASSSIRGSLGGSKSREATFPRTGGRCSTAITSGWKTGRVQAQAVCQGRHGSRPRQAPRAPQRAALIALL